MTALAYGVAAWLFVMGLYGVVTSRNLIHLVMCVSVTQSSTYVLLLTIGYRTDGTAPVLKSPPTTRFVDPIVATLTLTDVVVSATVTALLLAVVMQIHSRTKSLDPDAVDVLQR